MHTSVVISGAGPAGLLLAVGAVRAHEYSFAWLGILPDVAPSNDDLIYALHADGFAMHSMRSRQVSRQWKVQHFSQWMTDMFHVHTEESAAGTRDFRYRRQVGQLDYLTTSDAAMASLAEQYAGLPLGGTK